MTKTVILTNKRSLTLQVPSPLADTEAFPPLVATTVGDSSVKPPLHQSKILASQYKPVRVSVRHCSADHRSFRPVDAKNLKLAGLCTEVCPSLPQPLFPPTTRIIGYSITRNIQFFNALNESLEPQSWQSLRNYEELSSLPPTITQIVLHTGTNDMIHGQSGVLKRDFMK